MMGLTRIIDRFGIEGNIVIDSEQFPTEIFKQIIESGGVPALKVEVPVMVLTNGLTLTTDGDRTEVCFDFAATRIKIEVTP